jgi:uncharacterized protein with HEPN domain
MMDRKKKLYTDVYAAIELIEVFVSSTKRYSEYSKDLKTQSAVERQLAIIGEVLNQLRKVDEKLLDISSAQQIISFRNRLIHAYDSIDNSVVWAIVKKHLPVLKKEIENKI